jgi:putative peptidoglycan lipid II flippase
LAAGMGILQFEFTLVITRAIVLAGLVQLLIAGATWLMTGERRPRARIRAPNQTRTLFVRAGPGLIAAGIPQLKLIAAAAIVSASPAALSWLYYANRLYELPLGVASIAIAAVIVPRIAASLRNSEADAFAATQSRDYEIALGLALPAATGFAVLAQSIAGGLFQRGGSAPKTRRRSQPRWRRFARGFRATCWKKCLARCRSPTTTPIRR